MPKARNCYFEDEMELSFYEKYTFINCQLECAIKEVEKELGCVPWHLPRVIKSKRKIAINQLFTLSDLTPQPAIHGQQKTLRLE